MPKSQLRFPLAIGNQIKVAAHFTNVKFENTSVIGDTIYTEATFTYQGLVDMLLMVPKVTGTELDKKEEPKTEPTAQAKTKK